jgi:autotransporter family porin
MTKISTINSYVRTGITVGAGNYAGTLTIASRSGVKTTIAGQTAVVLDIAGTALINDGSIYGGPPGAGSVTGIGVLISANATVTNNGMIIGGYTSSNRVYAKAGAAVAMTSGTLLNDGRLYGGTARYGAGTRGDGVDASGKGYIFNAHVGQILGAPVIAAEGNPGIGVSLSGDMTLVNGGRIQGGSGWTYGASPGHGGAAGIVADGTGTIVNNFEIYGGVGGGNSVYHSVAQRGGDGIDILGVNTVTNSFMIVGGQGGQGGNAGSYAYDGMNGGAGGAGLNLASTGLVTNSGTVVGGVGGTATQAGSTGPMYSIGGIGGAGGFGAEIGPMGHLVNTGTLAGGYGSPGGESNEKYGGMAGAGGAGGDGVYLNGGTLTNAGTIEGGAGGHGGVNGGSYNFAPPGAAGLAVAFGAEAGTLVVQQGAVFIGDVVAAKDVADVLELSGKSTTTLGGFGTQFENFKHISFASGAAWEIAGTAAGLTTGETITGFGKADKIDITDAVAANGKVSVKTNGVVTIKAGGETYKLDIAGAVKGETDFKFSKDTLTKTGSAKMAFIAPPAAAAPQAGLPALHEMAAAPAKPATSGWVVPAAMHGAGLPDLTRVLHGAVPAMVTLQSG